MLSFIKLIRLPNLLIIALTQYLMRFCIIKPMLQINDFELQFGEFNFFLLVLSTTMVAAAGYIINDYFDTKIDRENDPSRVIVGKSIKRRVAIFAHIVLNVMGIAIGFYIAYQVDLIELAYIHIMWAGTLWFYSTSFKHKFLTGNILIALLVALVPLVAGLYEIPLLVKQYKEILITNNVNFNYIFVWIVGFSVFAFLTTLIREIIKDMEDIEGDRAYGSTTLPIIYGFQNAKIVVWILILLTIFLLGYIQVTHLNDVKTFIYFLLAIQLPLVLLIYKLAAAKEKKDFHFASLLTKLIMITGILYTVLVNYILISEFLT
ncbi:MAG: geranylgeranylglycerol-phosphate geranylgeranyltransferase [Bacteroidota bacterium]